MKKQRWFVPIGILVFLLAMSGLVFYLVRRNNDQQKIAIELCGHVETAIPPSAEINYINCRVTRQTRIGQSDVLVVELINDTGAIVRKLMFTFDEVK